MITVLISQGFGPSPHSLQQQPMRWAAFLADVRKGAYRSSYVSDDDNPYVYFGFVAYGEGPDGHVQVWQSNVDSSE